MNSKKRKSALSNDWSQQLAEELHNQSQKISEKEM